jgi:thiol-disulfide isomerase/thioredoxin
MKRIAYVAATAVVLAIGAATSFSSAPTAAPESTFVLLDGSRRSTTDLKGKVTLVNFWATSCARCVAEMPSQVCTYRKYQSEGFNTMAVTMAYDPPSNVANF